MLRNVFRGLNDVISFGDMEDETAVNDVESGYGSRAEGVFQGVAVRLSMVFVHDFVFFCEKQVDAATIAKTGMKSTCVAHFESVAETISVEDGV